MPVVVTPEIVQLLPIRYGEAHPWTRQPDGSELLVGDMIEASADPGVALSAPQQEALSLSIAGPQIDARRLRPYQDECVESVFAAWNAGRRAPLIVVATGGGKTVIAAEIARRIQVENPGFATRVWFLAHRKELLDQTYRLMKKLAPEATCGIVQGSRNDIGKFVTIGSVDTLATRRRFDEAISGTNGSVSTIVARPPTVVIVDECHHSTSPKYQRVLEWIREANPACKFLGMTATPGRTDGTALDRVFDCVAYERNVFQLISDGYLVPPVGFRVDLHIDLDVIPTDNGEFKRAPLSKVMSQPQVNQAVVDGYKSHGDQRKMIAFCVDVAHAKALADTFRMNGIIANHVDGAMKESDRAATLKAFADGSTRILTSCDVLTEGYDDPSAQGAIMARPTNSQVVYVQSVGRALRLHPSKRDALILDCVGNSQKHRLAQLASLAGLAQMDAGKAKPKGAADEEEIGQADVGGMNVERIDFRLLRQRASRWSWRETRFGWTVSIPRVGYFLLAWPASGDRSIVDVKFHDQRDGRRNQPPVWLSKELDFDMAYGLVEAEIERLFSARSSRFRRDKNESAELSAARDALEEGISGELFSPEELMRSDAGWRDRDTSQKQRDALIAIGVKPESVPVKAGEASDLYAVMTIERDAKAREPATEKQKKLISQQKLATHEELATMTKRAAQALIVAFLKKKESQKRADERFKHDDGAPPISDDDLR